MPPLANASRRAYRHRPTLRSNIARVIVGLVLAIPLVSLTASRVVGERLRAAGLLGIPEEDTPPPVLARGNTLTAELRGTGDASLHDLFRDLALVQAHRAMLPPAAAPAWPSSPSHATWTARCGRSVAANALAVQGSGNGLDRLAGLSR